MEDYPCKVGRAVPRHRERFSSHSPVDSFFRRIGYLLEREVIVVHELIKAYSERIDISLFCILCLNAYLRTVYLRGDISLCSGERACGERFLRYIEITELERSVRADEEICRLNVTVDYILRMGCLYRLGDLSGEFLDILLREVELSAPHELLQAVEVLHSDNETIADLASLMFYGEDILVLIADYVAAVFEVVHDRSLINGFKTLFFELFLYPRIVVYEDITERDGFYFKCGNVRPAASLGFDTVNNRRSTAADLFFYIPVAPERLLYLLQNYLEYIFH